MFTGIVTDVGEVVGAEPAGGGRRFRLACGYDKASIAIGASIACSGVCLTVTALERAADGRTIFSVDASSETLARSTLGAWKPGARVNLERSLKIGDELGGHIVTGHIDGVAELLAREDETMGARFSVRCPANLKRFVAEKGSVALDGTSLTVNGVRDDVFDLMLIPHSLAVTTWGDAKAGDRLNIEVDLMARYAARLAEAKA
jgi:riboflavin synthase